MFSFNSASDSGGAVSVEGGAHAIISGSTFRFNDAVNQGGAISVATKRYYCQARSWILQIRRSIRTKHHPEER
jgi:hypothetical protein